MKPDGSEWEAPNDPCTLKAPTLTRVQKKRAGFPLRHAALYGILSFVLACGRSTLGLDEGQGGFGNTNAPGTSDSASVSTSAGVGGTSVASSTSTGVGGASATSSTSTGVGGAGGQAPVCVPSSVEACAYNGPPEALGIGPCVAGTRTCADDGSGFDPCQGEILPVAEDCATGEDDDCDGLPNDDCVCVPGETQTCYSGPVGTLGVGACAAGARTCSVDGMSFGPCMGEILPLPENLVTASDENCDGVIPPMDVSIGEGYACALFPNGTLECWGDNGSGQLGDGTLVGKSAPTPVIGSGWASVSAGKYHACATKTDGSLWCWGYNLFGELGDGSSALWQSAPSQVPGTLWASVSAGA